MNKFNFWPILFPWSKPKSKLDAPVLVNGGVLKKFKRNSARLSCENPLTEITSDGEETIPCMEMTYGEYLDLKKITLENLLTDLQLTKDDWRAYVIEIGYEVVCPGSTEIYSELLRAAGFTTGFAFGFKYPDTLVDALYKETYNAYKKIVDDALPAPIFRTKNTQASEVAGYDVYEPSCEEMRGICCVYNEYIDTYNPILHKKEKLYSCKDRVSLDTCKSYTKRFGGDYDGYEFYSDYDHQRDESVNCNICDKTLYHIVYCTDMVPLIISNLSIVEKEQWYKDNEDAIQSGFISSINEYRGNISAAEKELIARQESGVCANEPPVTPTTPTPTPTVTVEILLWPSDIP